MQIRDIDAASGCSFVFSIMVADVPFDPADLNTLIQVITDVATCRSPSTRPTTAGGAGAGSGAIMEDDLIGEGGTTLERLRVDVCAVGAGFVGLGGGAAASKPEAAGRSRSRLAIVWAVGKCGSGRWPTACRSRSGARGWASARSECSSCARTSASTPTSS